MYLIGYMSRIHWEGMYTSSVNTETYEKSLAQLHIIYITLKDLSKNCSPC